VRPYFERDGVALYRGDMRDVLTTGRFKAATCVTDPPYGETRYRWDRWPTGWVAAVSQVLPPNASLWCFGTFRMFLEHAGEFDDWKYGQDIVWEKANLSGPTKRDRFARVHELLVHWYRGRWTSLHHEITRVPKSHAVDKSHRSTHSEAAPHRSKYGKYAYVDDGLRMPRSVQRAAAVRFHAYGRTDKPIELFELLVTESTSRGDLVIDPLAGSGTAGVAAMRTERRAILIDADRVACDQAVERLKAA